MSKQGDPIRTYRWQQLAKRVLAEEPLCYLCGLPIDHEAPPRSRYSPSVDHVIPWTQGGGVYDRANLRAAHFGHNSSKSDKTEGYTTGAGARGGTPHPTPPSPKSRRW